MWTFSRFASLAYDPCQEPSRLLLLLLRTLLTMEPITRDLVEAAILELETKNGSQLAEYSASNERTRPCRHKSWLEEPTMASKESLESHSLEKRRTVMNKYLVVSIPIWYEN